MKSLKIFNSDNAAKLAKENESLKLKLSDLSVKCSKLERNEVDLERLLNEQSGLMKALNVRKNFYFFIANCVVQSIAFIYNELAESLKLQ